MKLTKIIRRFRIDKPDKFRLADYDPADTCGLDIEKAEAKAMLADGVERLAALQEKLYAQDRWAVLVVFQAMDAAGKDGAIKHVMSGINPQGCQVHAFKAPSHEELDHDFLWRIAKALPERGRIGIFNRSHYEEVLVVRVHPELLARQRLPKRVVGKDIWDERFKSIRDVRAPSRAQRRADPEVLPAHLQGGAAQAFPRAARRAGEALEVRDGRRGGAQALGQVHARLRGRDPRTPAGPRRRGTSCRPTTNGSRGW